MLLTKKINNNVAFGVDDADHAIVVFGKGIGFHHMPYEITAEDDIQRVFHDVNSSIASAIASIDDDVLLASSDIVSLAKMELECKLNPNLPFTLADHIQFAIERRKEGLDIDNPLSGDVAFVYPTELGVARTGVAMVNNRVKGADLPEDEACAIALHIVNGEVGGANDESSISLVMTSAKIMTRVTAIIEEQTGVKLNRESYAYNRFAAHFRYLTARLMKNEEEKTGNSSLFEQASSDFPEVYACVKKINDYLLEEYGWQCSREELLYLMMHVNRLITAR